MLPQRKTIIKNTGYLYVRMILIMSVTLYTSRIVLSSLGIENYGVYVLVGGITTFLTFFSSSLSNASLRYLSIEESLDNEHTKNIVFNLIFQIYLLISILSFFFIVIIGEWLVNYKLVIPYSQIMGAHVVLITTGLIACVTIVSSAFETVMIAHENMKIYSILGIIDVLLKLLVAYSLVLIEGNRLIWYACLLMVITLVSRLIPMLYCMRKYEECKIRYSSDYSKLSSMSKFLGWNVLGCFAYVLNDQGTSFLLNIFFGPIVNAAKGIASQVNGATTQLTNNYYIAVRPQIIKSYATSQFSYMLSLIYDSSRYGYYLLWIIALPIILRINEILSIWLTKVPMDTDKFVIWILIFSLINTFSNPSWTAIQAIGKMKRYILIGSFISIIAFPICLIFLYIGFDAVVVFQILAYVRIIYVLCCFDIIRKFINFSWTDFFKKVFLKIGAVTIIGSVLSIILNKCFYTDTIGTIICCIALIILNALIIYLIGLTSSEKSFILKKILKND